MEGGGLVLDPGSSAAPRAGWWCWLGSSIFKLQALAANICKSPPGEQMLRIIQLNPSRLKCVMKDGERRLERKEVGAYFPPPFSLSLLPPCSSSGLWGLVPWVEPRAALFLPLLPQMQIYC